MRILLVEDEIFLANLTIKQLKKQNISVDSTYDGLLAYEMIAENSYDLIILDIMLPGMNGLDLLAKLRGEGNSVPVIMTSALSQIEDKIKALELGADDYMTKPYDAFELFARIKSNLRRSTSVELKIENEFGNLIYDRNTLNIHVGSEHLTLTLTEFNLLEYLITARPNSLSKEQIIDRIWGHNSDVTNNQVEVYISYLRKKLKLLNANIEIVTIRQVGYRIEELNV